MNTLSSDRIGELVIEALERTAFVLAETVAPDELESGFQPRHFARVTFTGAAEGAVVLAADDAFVLELASSFLGVEPDDVDINVEGRDALNELANIVGGSVILEYDGAVRQYNYGLPEAITKDQLPPEADDAVSCGVSSESGVLTVFWLPRADARAAA